MTNDNFLPKNIIEAIKTLEDFGFLCVARIHRSDIFGILAIAPGKENSADSVAKVADHIESSYTKEKGLNMRIVREAIDTVFPD